MFYNSNNIDSSFDTFLNVFNKHLDIHIPKQKNKRANYKISPRLPWISKSLLRSINTNNNLYCKYKMKRTEHSKMKYTLYKNTLTKVLLIEKKNILFKSINTINYKHDIKKKHGRSLNRL